MLQAIRELKFNFRFTAEYLPIIAFSFTFFSFVYKVISPFISNKLCKNYSKLSYNHKVEWNVRFTSTLFSLIVSTICVYVLLVDHALSQSPLIYNSMMVNTNIAIVIGYALSDIIIIISNYKIIGDSFTIFHHLLSLYGFSNTLTYSVMPYFANFRLIVELSTPLVNMRWFLYAMGFKKDSTHFFINGILMTMMFFAVRILSIPIYWYKVYTVLDSPVWIKMRNFRYVMIVTCILLDIINIYWFRKMFKGALIVWNTKWQHYEKHHKHQQLEMLQEYRKNIKYKLTNNLLYQSTLNGLNIINPSRYLSQNLYLTRVFNLVYGHNMENYESNDNDHMNLQNEGALGEKDL